VSGSPLHTQIQAAAARWIKRQHAGPHRYSGCAFVAVDPVTCAYEQPDVIGWNSCESVLVEVKVSRADFAKDKTKAHRVWTEGLGNARWFAVPVGMLRPAEIPDGWGLLEWDGRALSVAKDCTKRILTQQGLLEERRILVSLLRRIDRPPKGMICPT
jgi:hypothetical protein